MTTMRIILLAAALGLAACASNPGNSTDGREAGADAFARKNGYRIKADDNGGPHTYCKTFASTESRIRKEEFCLTEVEMRQRELQIAEAMKHPALGRTPTF